MLGIAGGLVMMRHIFIWVSMCAAMLVLRNPSIRLQPDMKHGSDPYRD